MSKAGDPTKSVGDERDRALARLEKALGEALQRSEAAEEVVEDQRQRLKALGAGREETMRALADARDELSRMTRERDELRKQLARIDDIQTATIALPDDFELSPPTADVPSLEDLMGALGKIQEFDAPHVAGHLHQRVHTPESDGSEEMISPQLVFPEQFAETAKTGEHREAGPAVARVLVLLDPERPIKYPIYKESMTLGRADIADIQIDNGFLSRLHARFISTAEGVTVEDIESKNGIRINTKQTQRQLLRHGDIVDLGRLRFRFLDTASDDAAD